jgi:Family of unknown function (DUF5924)
LTNPKPSFRARAHRFWGRHRKLFWSVHSVWALANGVTVVILARERYAFVPWVIVLLSVTWLSTLFFGRRPAAESTPPAEPSDAIAAPGVRDELASYVTRILYQETLFFLLPFYAYSTVPGSANVLFLVFFGGLAVFSCLDLSFDRWLRTSAVFGLVFFATVAFAAINLLLPIVLGIDPEIATRVAAIVAVASAVPLTVRAAANLAGGARVRLGLAAGTILAVPIGLPSVVPPAPLRMTSATFASRIDRQTLELTDTLTSGGSSASTNGVLIVLVQVFAPAAVPTNVSLQWKRDGRTFRTSRRVDIVAHDAGFRVWDSWRPESNEVPPGRYEVTLKAHGGRVFGVAELLVTSP